MEIIPVTPERSLELEETQWRLVQDQDNGKTLLPLVVADREVIKFHPRFLETHTSLAAEMPTASVSKVVVGWIPEHQAWQVGFFLNTTDPTWCEVATWNGNLPGRNENVAKAAARALSEIMNSPLQTIERDVPSPESSEPQSTQPSMHTSPLISIDLKPLPLAMGDWVLVPSAEGSVWQLTSQWTRRLVLRAALFLVGMVIFLFLAIGSLRSGLAAVAPEWLPFIAVAIALVLAFSAMENIWKLVARQQIVLDTLAREVRCERVLTQLVEWRVPFEGIDYVLVSQEPSRPQGRRSAQDPMQIAQDTWVHLYAQQQFYAVSELEDSKGQSWQWEVVRRRTASDERLALVLSEYDTPVHHAAQHMAHQLGINAYVDIR